MIKRLFFTVAAALCGILTGFAGQISVNGPILAASGTATVEIVLSNERTDLVAFQMDLTLPEGVGIDKAGCSLYSRITDKAQELTIGKLESGAYRLISMSPSLKPISGQNGTLLILQLTTAEGCVGGEATISNILFSTSGSERVKMDDVSFSINTLYKVTFKYGDEVLTTETVEFGSVIPLPESLNSERYTLVKWLDVPETMPARDITIQADFIDGVRTIQSTGSDTDFYQLNGVKNSQLERGLNIIHTKDGKVQKVLIKQGDLKR